MIQISMLALRIRAALALALACAYFLFVVVPDIPSYAIDDVVWLSIPVSYFALTFVASIVCLVRNVRSAHVRQILAGSFEGVILFSGFVLFMYFREEPWRRADGVFKFIWLYVSFISMGYPAALIGAGLRAVVYGGVKLWNLRRATIRCEPNC